MNILRVVVCFYLRNISENVLKNMGWRQIGSTIRYCNFYAECWHKFTNSELAKLVILLLSLVLTSYIQAGGLGRFKQLFVAYFERNKKVVCRSYWSWWWMSYHDCKVTSCLGSQKTYIYIVLRSFFSLNKK